MYNSLMLISKFSSLIEICENKNEVFGGELRFLYAKMTIIFTNDIFYKKLHKSKK